MIIILLKNIKFDKFIKRSIYISLVLTFKIIYKFFYLIHYNNVLIIY